MSDGTSGQGPAPADEFDRELRELTEGTAPAPLFLEPSAAERAQASAADAGKAGDRGRHGRRTGALVLVALLVVAGGLLWVGYMRSAPNAGPEVAGPVPSPTAASPMGTITPVDLFGGPPSDPFAGTPADGWADGAAGIVTPPARPVGHFTAAQVAAAYATTRKLLIAGNLDRQTLLGGPPTAFAKLLTAEQRATFLASLNKMGLDKAGSRLSTRLWVASFAPGSAELIGNVVKVHGTMSARPVAESGGVALAIVVNYIFAYAIEPPHQPADWMRLLDHQYGSIDFAPWDDPGGALEPWDRTIIGHAGIQCGTTDGYIHPDYPSERSANVSESGPAINPYSSATTIPGGGAACGRTTGT